MAQPNAISITTRARKFALRIDQGRHRSVERLRKLAPHASFLDSSKDLISLGGAAGKMPAPTMQFSAFVYVADEEEGVAKLDVLRLGDQSRDSQVKWITTDCTVAVVLWGYHLRKLQC
eukprot:s3_g45.t1